MQIDLEKQAPQAYNLHAAILLYSNKDGTLAVHHQVRNDKHGTHLAPGTFVTQPLFDKLAAMQNRATLDYVPPNVLAISQNAVAWFEPASLRPMYFDPDSDKALKAFDGCLIPQPPLVFIASGRSLCVYALKNNERPDKDTPLFKAPYWNVFDDGDVCRSTMHTPKGSSPDKIGEWTAAFFISSFTHLSGLPRWKHSGTYAEMLQECIDRNAFSPEWLKPQNLKLGEALCGRSRKGS